MKWAVRGARLPGYGWKMFSAVLCFLLFATGWYYQQIHIPDLLAGQEAFLRSSLDLSVMEQTPVLILEKGGFLAKGQPITPEQLETIRLQPVPHLFLPDAYLTSMEDVAGLVPGTDLSGGRILAPSDFYRPEDLPEADDRLINVVVRDLQLNSLAPGKYVDLLADRGDGTYRVLVSKTPVHQVGRNDGNAYEILIPVNEQEMERLWQAGQHSLFFSRTYLDPDQPPTPIIPPEEETPFPDSGSEDADPNLTEEEPE